MNKRRYPIGAEIIGRNETHFRVWAPKAKTLDVVLHPDNSPKFQPLTPEEGGYFAGSADCGAGALYKFRINRGEIFYPDPASRFNRTDHTAVRVWWTRLHSNGRTRIGPA